jgi:hypothetical protein
MVSENGGNVPKSYQNTRFLSTILSPSVGSFSARRGFSSGSSPSLEGYYRIEVSNGLEDDSVDDDGSLTVVYATKLTVTGPDVDGILASMTVALAMRGCSLVSLHAAKSEDMGWRHNKDKEATNLIKDVFYVVDRLTGQPFRDDELYDLAESLLEALSKPMSMLGGPSTAIGANDPAAQSIQHIQKKHPTPPYPTRREQITVIPSTGAIGSE